MLPRRWRRRRREDLLELVPDRLFRRGTFGGAQKHCNHEENAGNSTDSSHGAENLGLLLRQLGQHGFVQANAGIHILEREVLVRRMRAAIRQRETKQKRLDSENGAKL